MIGINQAYSSLGILSILAIDARTLRPKLPKMTNSEIFDRHARANFLKILKNKCDFRNQRIKMHQKIAGERTSEKLFAKGVTLIHSR